MDHIELLQRMSVALAIGLLIGIERGWASRGEKEGERTAGLRTIALSGLLGGVIGAMALRLEGGAIVLALGFAAFAAIIALFRRHEMEHEGTYGATTVVATMLSFALGSLAVVGEPMVAAAAGVAAAGLLALKSALHGWLRNLTFEELRAGLILLAMSLIFLPVLPDRGFGPFAALNPYDLWLMTILIAGVSFAGYVAMKWIGGAHGIALSGIAGGLVSSTAVTLSYARLARETPERTSVLMGGALLAAVTMMLRILLVAGSINQSLMRWLLLPIGLAALVTAAISGWKFWHGADDSLASPLTVKNPFELSTVLRFTALLAVIMVAAKALVSWAGDWGAYALGAVSGVADVDAITLSMSRLSTNGLDLETAAAAILLAAAVNTISKAGMAWAAGGNEPGRQLGLAAAAAIAAGTLGFWLTHAVDPVGWLIGG